MATSARPPNFQPARINIHDLVKKSHFFCPDFIAIGNGIPLVMEKKNQNYFFMSNITRSTVTRPATLKQVVDEMLNETITRFFVDEHWGDEGRQAQNRVPVNIYETATAYDVELVAPGGNKSDFQVTCANRLLSISYRPSSGSLEKAEQRTVIRNDFRLLPFHLSFSCDESIDTDGLSARYENGVLLLTLPKRQSPKSLAQTITIQ